MSSISRNEQVRLGLGLALLLALLNIAVWVLLPLLLDGSIRLDVAEGVIGGDAWRLSYLRHPPFSTWLVGLASSTGPLRYGAIYLAGQVLAVGALLIVALFLRQVAGNGAAALALAAGLASPFATYVPIQVSHNIGLMPFWALALAASWFAFERGRLEDWIMLGLAVGLGLWAKYAILHLMVPLGLAFVAMPRWRRQMLTPGPWVAALVAGIVIVPHALDVLAQGGTTLSFALRTVSVGWGSRISHFAGLLLNCALVMLPMAGLAALAAGGVRPLVQAIEASIRKPRPIDVFLHAAAYGPVLLLCMAALAGVRPRFLWLTPFMLSFAAWWANAAVRDRQQSDLPADVLPMLLGLMSAYVVAFVAVAFASPMLRSTPRYADLDARAFAARAEAAWQRAAGGPIPYIVSLGDQRGRQAAGSLRIELPSRPSVLENGSKAYSPWIDEADLRRRGALVVSPAPIPDGFTVLGKPVVAITRDGRPAVRGGGSVAVWFAVVPPAR